MSQEKFVEVVQRAFEAWNRGDIDAFLAHLCLDVEAVPFGAALEGKVCRGHPEVHAWWLAHSEVWETFLLCAEEFEPVGTELVVSGHWERLDAAGGAVHTGQLGIRLSGRQDRLLAGVHV
jgi:ketosteroid isomerase-like protein